MEVGESIVILNKGSLLKVEVVENDSDYWISVKEPDTTDYFSVMKQCVVRSVVNKYTLEELERLLGKF